MTPDDVDPQARLHQLQATREQLEHRLHMLGEGTRSGFWDYLSAYLRPMKDVGLQRLLTEKDPYEMARLQARYALLQDILSWPERELRGIQGLIGQEK